MKKNTLILPVIISSLFWSSALRAKGITIFHTNYLHAHVTPFKAPYIIMIDRLAVFPTLPP